MGLKDVQKHYRLPQLKRGMKVTYEYGKRDAVITGTPRYSGSNHINIRDENGQQYTVHPFELDYWTDESTVVTGKELQQKYDGAWNSWNEALNKAYHQQKLDAVIKCINETGYRGRESLKRDTGTTDQQIDKWIAEGHLCILSDGLCIDIPQRRDARVAYWREKYEGHRK